MVDKELNEEELEKVNGGYDFFAQGDFCSSYSSDDNKSKAGDYKSCWNCKYFNCTGWLYSCSQGKTPNIQK